MQIFCTHTAHVSFCHVTQAQVNTVFIPSHSHNQQTHTNYFPQDPYPSIHFLLTTASSRSGVRGEVAKAYPSGHQARGRNMLWTGCQSITGGNQSNPMQTRGEHTNSKQKDPRTAIEPRTFLLAVRQQF